MKKRIISILLAVIMLISVLPAGTITALAAYENTYKNTGNQRNDIIGVAKTQIGYREGNNNDTKYGSWYGLPNQPWCAMFVSWCARQAGIPTSVLKNSAVAAPDSQYFNIPYYNGSSYTPKPGDLFFTKSWSHVGLVYSIDGNYFYTIEGNSNSGGSSEGIGVFKLRRKISDYYFGVPNYGGSSVHTHSYTNGFEAAHPHKVYQKCSCGKTKYVSPEKHKAYHKCSTCMKLSTAYVMPVKAYTINTGKTKVYSTVNGNVKSNKIYDTDLCTISQIYNCGWCKVTFPLDKGGTDTGYCKIGVFLKGGGFTIYTSKQITTYRRSDLKTSNGYAGKGDKIYILGNTSNAVQIAYPLSAGGWKAGWIPISAIKATIIYRANGGSGKMSNSSVQYKSDYKLDSNTFTRTGYAFGGWNAYRSSDKTWHVPKKGWKTSDEIFKKGYKKSVYMNRMRATLEKSWIGGAKTNETLNFNAVWTPNELSVNYNANGGTITSDTYKLSGSVIYRKSNNKKHAQIWTYNSAQKNGLYNASTFGLAREGYTFKGWGTKASGGTIFNQNDGTLVPTKISAAVKNGNCTVTLYAIWEKKEKPAAHTHEWNTDYTIDKEASCSETGLKSIHCKSCSETKDAVVIPVEEHLYSDVITKAAACTQEGIREKVCSECGLHTDSETIPALGHEFGEWETEKEATASEDGVEIRKCENCGFEESRTVDFIPVYDETAPRIFMESVKAKAGEEVTVKLVMENNPGITALRLSIDFDENVLEMTDFRFGEALSSMNKGTSEKYGSPYSFSMYSASADLEDCGTLAVIKFKVKENAENGEYPVNITYDKDDIFNLNGDSVSFDVETGAVMLNSCLLGDINDDGKINMRDVVLLQQVINGWNVTYNKEAVDYNGDGKTNMRDIVALQQYING